MSCFRLFERAGLSGIAKFAFAGVLFFQDISVFDGQKFLSHQSVVVSGRKISAMGDAGKIPPPLGAEVVRGEGLTLLPGLIDAHTHVVSEDNLAQALQFGVTAEFDMFMHAGFAAGIKSRQRGGALPQADLFSAGYVATAPGGHGTEYGMAIPLIKGPDEADRFVQARIQEGSDYIKIIYDDGLAYGLSWPTLSYETLKAVILAAHRRGKLAHVHVWSKRHAMEALSAGADSLQHIFADHLPDEAFLDLIAGKNVFVTPTLTIVASAHEMDGSKKLMGDPNVSPYLSDTDRTYMKTTLPRLPGATTQYAKAKKAVWMLVQRGVPILAGSDATNFGVAHGASLHQELELLVDAGLGNDQALSAATSAPAKAFRLKDRGRVAPGFRADLVLVRGNPQSDIKTTRNILAVWKEGKRVVSREKNR